MDQSVITDSSVTVSQNNIDVLTNTTIFTWTPDETNAGWYIIVVIGFFAFIIISSMVVNQLHAEPQEEDILTDLFNSQTSNKKMSVKLFQRNPVGYMNQAYSEAATSNQDSEHHKGRVIKAKRTQRDEKKEPSASASTSAQDQASEAVICITTVS